MGTPLVSGTQKITNAVINRTKPANRKKVPNLRLQSMVCRGRGEGAGGKASQ
jgi:hypothetical protein